MELDTDGGNVTPLERIDAMKMLVKDINKILSKNGIHEQISLSDITVTDKTVLDGVNQNSILSTAITNHLWQSIPSATVFHYTSLIAAESILNTNLFRLTNIAKRYGEGEIETFCRTHQLDGYLENDETGNPKYKSLMSNTYYASFTDTNITKEDEAYFWRRFAPCDGVRLKLQVTASAPDFRKIKYEQKKGQTIPIITDLTNCIREKYNREFILKGISRLCSFYLSGEDYGVENEYRALYRDWGTGGPQPKGEEQNSYIELPLGLSKCGYQIDVIDVYANERPNMPDSFVFSKRDA